VKAARKLPEDIESDRYEYNKPKAGRLELVIKMTYAGKYSGRFFKKKRFTATIKGKIDSLDRDSWEVLDVEYKDDNKIRRRKASPWSAPFTS
jgi:hypothetical protein